MSSGNGSQKKSTRLILDPPTFSPPGEMRAEYLAKRRAELDGMLVSAKGGVWKPVMAIVNNVRGTGAMYGFSNMGAAAEALVKAVQNGSADSAIYLDAYAKAVNESYV